MHLITVVSQRRGIVARKASVQILRFASAEAGGIEGKQEISGEAPAHAHPLRGKEEKPPSIHVVVC
jgi:hypothetical protein